MGEKEKYIYHALSMLDQMSFAIDSEPDSWGETLYNSDAYAVHDLFVDGYIEVNYPSLKAWACKVTYNNQKS